MEIGVFNLTKFQSNKKEVVDSLPAQNVNQSTGTLYKYGGNIHQTLGIHWDITDDNFFFTSKIIDSPSTERGLLSAVSTIFDRIGLLALFTLKAKLLLLSLWRLKIGCDKLLGKMVNEFVQHQSHSCTKML